MTNEAIVDAFKPVESLGFSRIGQMPIVLESESHRVCISLMDRHSTVACDVVLKLLPNAVVDAYSIIAAYDRAALEAFVRSSEKRTDERVAQFIARELAGPCAMVFRVTDTSEWMIIHQKHRQSVHRRNDVFWHRVNGFDDGRSFAGEPNY